MFLDESEPDLLQIGTDLFREQLELAESSPDRTQIIHQIASRLVANYFAAGNGPVDVIAQGIIIADDEPNQSQETTNIFGKLLGFDNNEYSGNSYLTALLSTNDKSDDSVKKMIISEEPNYKNYALLFAEQDAVSPDKLSYWSSIINSILTKENFWISLSHEIEDYFMLKAQNKSEKLGISKNEYKAKIGLTDFMLSDLSAISTILEDSIGLRIGHIVDVECDCQITQVHKAKLDQYQVIRGKKDIKGVYQGLTVLAKNKHPSGIISGLYVCIAVSDESSSAEVALLPTLFLESLRIIPV